MSQQKSQQESNNKILMKYAGLTMQIMVALGFSVYLGLKLDEWLSLSAPLLVWILPLLVIVALIWQVIKDTSKKK